MKRLILPFLALAISAISAGAQDNTITIPFLDKAPVIDGLPDRSTNALQWCYFSSVDKSNEENENVTARYKVAYGYEFLYLLIETDCDTIVYRDRAYQNGDGFHMVIAKPASGRPTDEFYVLRFSPGDASRNTPPRRNEWYYNIGLSWKPLSFSTGFACCSLNGRSYFETLLSWNDVYPYNPLLSDSIGINLCFVKAIGGSEKNYYYFKYDDRIQNELSGRQYLYAVFRQPGNVTNPHTTAMLNRRHIETGCPLQIRTVSSSNTHRRLIYDFTLSRTDERVLTQTKKEVQVTAGLNANVFDLPVERLPPGEYRVAWKSSDKSEGETSFSVLPNLNYLKEQSSLGHLKPLATPGSYNTLAFMLQDIFRRYRELKPYETAESIRKAYTSYRAFVTKLESGEDSLAHRTGTFRRAFLSAIDTTLQPYTVRVPDDYNSARKYPLLIMLHGSGSDDQGMLSGTELTQGDFVEIAPNGRGTSNCFTTDGAEIDVREAIDDAIRNYAVDTARIVIAGFSMGGYGAYRIFYECPRLFKGVAVFSGNPSLATRWIGEGFPDFLYEKYLKPFNDVPVFIYHSKNDLNCPYGLTERLVQRLEAAGAKVEFVTSEESGHGIIDAADISRYYEWLRGVIK